MQQLSSSNCLAVAIALDAVWRLGTVFAKETCSTSSALRCVAIILRHVAKTIEAPIGATPSVGAGSHRWRDASAVGTKLRCGAAEAEAVGALGCQHRGIGRLVDSHLLPCFVDAEADNGMALVTAPVIGSAVL